MAYRVKIESFEGPFDLLLYLVSKNKVDVETISITDIANQYLAEINKMQKLDLDVASDFLLTAATLLKIKAESLLFVEGSTEDADIGDLAPSDARAMLVEKLITYKQFKNVAATLMNRANAESRMHTRCVGIEDEFGYVTPDYLANIELRDLGKLAAQAFARREVELLESKHIAKKSIPVEVYMEKVMCRLGVFTGGENGRGGLSVSDVGKQTNDKASLCDGAGKTTFYDLLEGNSEPPVVVVTFLAILELHKRGCVSIHQEKMFGNIDVEYIEAENVANKIGEISAQNSGDVSE